MHPAELLSRMNIDKERELHFCAEHIDKFIDRHLRDSAQTGLLLHHDRSPPITAAGIADTHDKSFHEHQ